jgi:hypothetical protein
MAKTAREIRDESRDAAIEVLALLRKLPKERLGPGDLLRMFETLALYGGLPPADKAWAAAMEALASPNLSEARKEQLLAILQGREEERRELTEAGK